ncbi:MAG: hypothetical protein K9H25_17275 [Rhodospirillum sp.]|nr:hypothetical protein [Rhodospirillum sp.]MCF8502107.1 hypothetical protein [Rhodospirillum sp.]
MLYSDTFSLERLLSLIAIMGLAYMVTGGVGGFLVLLSRRFPGRNDLTSCLQDPETRGYLAHLVHPRLPLAILASLFAMFPTIPGALVLCLSLYVGVFSALADLADLVLRGAARDATLSSGISAR